MLALLGVVSALVAAPAIAQTPVAFRQLLDPSAAWQAVSGEAPAIDGTRGLGNDEASFSATSGMPPAGFGPSANATTNVGGFTFDLNTFLGADAYYDNSTPIIGQNTITTNLEADETLLNAVLN
jgi:hypothetical protein